MPPFWGLRCRAGTVSRRDTGIELDSNSPNGLRATLNATIKSDEAGNEEVVAHEGSHVADYQDFVNAMGKVRLFNYLSFQLTVSNENIFQVSEMQSRWLDPIILPIANRILAHPDYCRHVLLI